ncbi:14.7 kDa ribonuclease H-like protein [Fervidicola ferrireducens]|jgi:ribonuclease HI|uniref:14.7 kDa ribonuclease H-like protein n=1 Tax=Fervidicola ferrireducens TaxID=520764 RepID=A0A140LD71_9FIRM|nr:ribonuclease HI family protein [Fervidicola ferrireducens]KXG78496.1 14.7 kDa ribonuclease H-like protein [Fervidicola ferrireducens]MCF6095908.1 ribonuclease HI family protein [Thermovorax subterraneus]
MERLKVYVDGASRGNPGDAGIGIVMLDENGNVVKEMSDYIGQTTNNIAEYTALIIALKEALEMGCEEIEVFSDSELMVKQINGQYQIKNEGIKRLYSQVVQLMKEFRSFSINHVRREYNKRADELANEGIDMALGDEEVIDI